MADQSAVLVGLQHLNIETVSDSLAYAVLLFLTRHLVCQWSVNLLPLSLSAHLIEAISACAITILVS